MIRWHKFQRRHRRRIRLRPQRARLISFVRFPDGGTFAVWNGPLPDVIGTIALPYDRYVRQGVR